ncbi:MAG: transposase [Clostridiales bacterium]|nr:transposase [Clostridiales bacterium]MDR2749195.1 transposase [Clostridiales bacterium]
MRRACGPGKTGFALCRKHGIPESTVRTWKRRYWTPVTSDANPRSKGGQKGN